MILNVGVIHAHPKPLISKANPTQDGSFHSHSILGMFRSLLSEFSFSCFDAFFFLREQKLPLFFPKDIFAKKKPN